MTDDTRPGPPTDGPDGSEPGADDERRLRDLLGSASDMAGAPDAFSAIYAVRGRVRGRRLLRTGVGGCLAAGLVAGVVTSAVVGGHKRPVPVADQVRPPIHLTGALVSFTGCNDYLTYVRSRAEAMVGAYGLQSSGYPYRGPMRYAAVGGGVAIPQAADNAAASLPAGAPAGATQSAVPYSHTNDQVAGVDEPDTVKTDGHLVVTLEGSTLRVLDTSARVLGSVQLAGDTGGGFLLVGDRAVVLSSPPPAVPGTATAEQSWYPMPYASANGVPATTPTAQASVVDLSDPADPRLVHTFDFDGGIVAARLVGQQVRLVLRSDGPRLSFVTPSSAQDAQAATAANKGLIAASTLTDWLPSWQVETPDGAKTARQPLSACDAVARPDQASGISTVTVLSLDAQSGTPGPGTSVVAAGDTVYASADRVYVAGPSAGSDGQIPAGQPSGCCSIAPPVGATTRIYAFDFPASGPASFAGEGTVPGWLVNSYAMDEDTHGRLRVASTSVPAGGTSQSQITVLAPSGGQLTAVGSVAGLGRGEYLRAVRFIGDQAYVVTFQTYDPLYVVDLSHPAKPVLTGELDQPGFSEFLYPLPDHRLLGVGVQMTGNEPSGLVVATYDVSDPAHPRRIDASTLAQGWFGQTYDPHAFLYWPPVGLALLAVPDGPAEGNAGGVAAYQIGANGSLTRTATLGHGRAAATRSLVIGGQAWVTTAAGVVTANLTDLAASSWHSY